MAPPPPPPPKVDQVKFVKPVVAKAEEVVEEPPKIVEIKDKKIGDETIKGDPNAELTSYSVHANASRVLEISNLMDSTDPDLSKFNANGGKLVPLGVSSPQRSPQISSVAPIADTLPGFEAQSWTGMIAPAGTPKPITDKLHAALMKALASPDVREKLSAQGVEVVGGTQAEFADWLAKESQRWGKVIKDTGTKAE